MTKTKKKNPWLVLLMLLLICLLIWPTGTQIAYAAETQTEETTYSNVLTDLKKDENFKQEDYPYKEDDYSLKVIQVAESEDNELFVYVYQPSGEKGNLVATSINMSTSVHKLDFHMYDLTLLNSNGMFYKYLVNDFIVGNVDERTYDIASIFRPWNEDYDDPSDNDNTITYVPFEVAKIFTITDTETKCFDTEVVEVSDKYVGFVRYDDGYSGIAGTGMTWYKPGSDAHFIAFSTEQDIDKLYEATVYYCSQSYTYSYNQPSYLFQTRETYGTIEKGLEKKVSYDEYVTIKNNQGLISGREFSFNRIQSVEDFIKSEDRNYVYDMLAFNVNVETKLTDEGLAQIKDKQWVIRFLETDYTNKKVDWTICTEKRIEKTIISNVSILELKFETDGIVYNLGVIDNQQTGDLEPDNETNVFYELADWVKWLLRIVGIILLVVLLIVCLPVVVVILKGLWWLIKNIGKIIWYVISAPFKLFDKGEK